MKKLLLVFAGVVCANLLSAQSLSNGSFENEGTGWTVKWASNITASYPVDASAIDGSRVGVFTREVERAADGQFWNYQIEYSIANLNIEDNTNYIMTYYAKADAADLTIHHSKFLGVGNTKYNGRKTSTDWQKFEVDYNFADFSSLESGKQVINFQFLNKGTYYIDNIIISKATATSIEDEKSIEEKMKVYPNPASDVLNIQIDNALGANVNYVIYDLAGNPVLKGRKASVNLVTINCSEMATGNYILKLQTENATLIKKVIIK
ncbi:MAG: T9SS type A sorting domain-containing protein [Bacteroidales bacterium]|nr:T9SS type A sorting domain-containing protein [Bacteroidales bacterium]